jgi:hypothetical protein
LRVDKSLSGAELALLHMRILLFGRGSLADPVRLGPGPEVLALGNAAARLAAEGRAVSCQARRDGAVLVVDCVPVAEAEAGAHRTWVASVVRRFEAEYGSRGAVGELQVVGGDELMVIGTARWQDLLDWVGSYTGDAWGGGISAPDEQFGDMYAAVLSIGFPPGGGRSVDASSEGAP